MNTIRVVKTGKDYEEALKYVEVLMAQDPDPESEKGEQLELLSALIKDYESRAFPETLPSPVEAIKYRMEQANLRPADLVQYLGSRSRVSEILSGKRKLTVEMMRALEEGLCIPAKVLLKEPEHYGDSIYTGWGTSLVKEMSRRGYFGKKMVTESNFRTLLEGIITSIGTPVQIQGMFRKSHYRLSPLTDKHALLAWVTHVYQEGQKYLPLNKYKPGTINLDFMRALLKLSVEKNGPLLTQKYLAKHGIILVIEPHFSKTYLDGATLLISKENPIIGLTLRHDRLDNFWYTLLHELAHIALHYDSDISLFYDELEGLQQTGINNIEQEADSLAEEAVLPKAKWEISPARLIPSVIAADSLAHELGVHIAIIAGQIRHKGNKYNYLSKIVNDAKVRKYFSNVKWDI